MALSSYHLCGNETHDIRIAFSLYACSFFRLEGLLQKRESHEKELDEFHDLVRQMAERKATLEQDVKVHITELAEKNKKIETLSNCVNELKQTINDQEFSVDDIYKMESELKGLSEAHDRALVLRDQNRKALLSSEAELVSVCNDLDSLTAEYNGYIAELQLVPELGSKFANMKVEFNKQNLLETDRRLVLGIDLVGTVQVAAVSSRGQYDDMIDTAKLNYQESLEQMNHVENAVNEADVQLQIRQSQKASSEKVIQTERSAFNSKVAVHEREAEAMETKIATIQDPVALEEQMAGIQRQCAELEALRVERQEEQAANLRALVAEINEAYQLMSDHAAHLQTTVARVDAYCQDKLNQMENVVTPTNVE
jgi:chromosome segregation ATPase